MASEKANTRIPLGRNKFLISDGMACWIVREVKTKTGKAYDRRLSGYHGSISNLIQSYFDREVLSGDVKTLQELGEHIDKTRKEIRGWLKKMEMGMK